MMNSFNTHEDSQKSRYLRLRQVTNEFLPLPSKGVTSKDGWLQSVCNENPLAPLIRHLGLALYRTSRDNSVLYDHDLESYMLFNKEGNQVPQLIVIEVGEAFKKILKEIEKVRDENHHDLSVLHAISVVLETRQKLRQQGCWSQKVTFKY